MDKQLRAALSDEADILQGCALEHDERDGGFRVPELHLLNLRISQRSVPFSA
jgi:hypothetical protein